MFTGIITALGTVRAITPLGNGADMRLVIATPWPDISEVALGASIACSGCCLTAVELGADCFAVDASAETLSRTTLGTWKVGTSVNLERSLKVGDELGGHIVSGHVDGVGEVIAFDPVGDNRLLRIRAPKGLGHYLARKGSVTVNGCSLTTNEVKDVRGKGTEFTINLIPHTLSATTLGGLAAGLRVNLEVDLIARYCERLLAGEKN
jgi:riboflavin synthase